MSYEEFLEYIKLNLASYAEDYERYHEELDDQKETKQRENQYEVELHKVIKNNGIELDGITLRKKGERISPNIYLNNYFENYQMGKPISNIMEEIFFQYKKAIEDNHIEVANVLNFKEIKDRIIIRLVNYEKNKEQLKDCPHKKYLDLAITFRYIAGKDMMGIATSLISNQEFNLWNIEVNDLYPIALRNTMREFPWQMDSLTKVIADCFKDKISELLPEETLEDLERIDNKENGVNMYVLTNESGINGATCILYDQVIKNFANVQECNIYLLPSSVHEMMLVPENVKTEPDFLANLVVEANQSAVGFIDLLSDNIYYYDREKDEINIYKKKVS